MDGGRGGGVVDLIFRCDLCGARFVLTQSGRDWRVDAFVFIAIVFVIIIIDATFSSIHTHNQHCYDDKYCDADYHNLYFLVADFTEPSSSSAAETLASST